MYSVILEIEKSFLKIIFIEQYGLDNCFLYSFATKKFFIIFL